MRQTHPVTKAGRDKTGIQKLPVTFFFFVWLVEVYEEKKENWASNCKMKLPQHAAFSLNSGCSGFDEPVAFRSSAFQQCWDQYLNVNHCLCYIYWTGLLHNETVQYFFFWKFALNLSFLAGLSLSLTSWIPNKLIVKDFWSCLQTFWRIFPIQGNPLHSFHCANHNSQFFFVRKRASHSDPAEVPMLLIIS